MFAAARFSRRCATDDVPGINRMFGDLCNSHASAICIGIAPRRSATAESNQSLLLELGQCFDLLGDGTVLRTVARSHRPIVDDVECLQPKIAKIVVDIEDRQSDVWVADVALH
jgi:hypothetical protein